MKVTIKCPRCPTGRIFLQPFITDRGLIDGYEAICLLCSRDFTAELKRVQQRSAA